VLRSQKDREASSFPHNLIIPLGAAFGTGEHRNDCDVATNARETDPKMEAWLVDYRSWNRKRILTLAACLLGARRVIGIDNDPVAISTAKEKCAAEQNPRGAIPRQRRASLEISVKELPPPKRLRRPSQHHHRESV